MVRKRLQNRWLPLRTRQFVTETVWTNQRLLDRVHARDIEPVGPAYARWRGGGADHCSRYAETKTRKETANVGEEEAPFHGIIKVWEPCKLKSDRRKLQCTDGYTIPMCQSKKSDCRHGSRVTLSETKLKYSSWNTSCITKRWSEVEKIPIS